MPPVSTCRYASTHVASSIHASMNADADRCARAFARSVCSGSIGSSRLFSARSQGSTSLGTHSQSLRREPSSQPGGAMRTSPEQCSTGVVAVSRSVRFAFPDSKARSVGAPCPIRGSVALTFLASPCVYFFFSGCPLGCGFSLSRRGLLPFEEGGAGARQKAP